MAWRLRSNFDGTVSASLTMVGWFVADCVLTVNVARHDPSDVANLVQTLWEEGNSTRDFGQTLQSPSVGVLKFVPEKPDGVERRSILLLQAAYSLL
jgi:hypothetical protein